MEAAGVEPASEDGSGRASTRVGSPFGGLALAGGGRPASATSQRCLDLRVLAGQEVQPGCVGALRLQAEAAGTVVTWFYQAARATALSFAVAGLPLFTWPGAPRRATRTSPSPSKPVRPLCQRTNWITMGRGRWKVNRPREVRRISWQGRAGPGARGRGPRPGDRWCPAGGGHRGSGGRRRGRRGRRRARRRRPRSRRARR